MSKLFFIHPIRHSIDDFIELSVFRNLTFSVVVQEFNEMDVVVAHEGNLPTVCRPHRNLLRSTLRKGFQLRTGNGIDIILCLERTAINTFGLSLDEHFRTVRRQDVPVERIDFRTHRMVHVKQYGRLLSRLERVPDNAFAVFTDSCILVGTRYGFDSAQTLCRKSTILDGLQGDSFC